MTIPCPPALAALALLLLGPALPARADVLELTDGRFVEGLVVKAGDAYHVQSRFGPSTVPVASVKAHRAARPIDQQVRDHLAALDPEDAENRALLARWLHGVGREEEGLAMATAVLEIDPESSVAHGLLGHVRHQGVWRTPDEARRAEGLERHGDRWYTPQEWANQTAAVREAALAAERSAEADRLRAEVNRSVRLMLSPDRSLRARGRERLLAMAREYDDPSLTELARNVDDYVRKLEEVREAAVAAAGLSPSGTGTVLSEVRATMSRLKRPIQTFETSLGGSVGGAPVRIQLPELEVIDVRATVPIPVVVR